VVTGGPAPADVPIAVSALRPTRDGLVAPAGRGATK
jgi:hypothetical protein